MFSPLRKTDPDWFKFPWLEVLIPRWAAGELVSVGTVRRPNYPCGYALKVTAIDGGQTGAREPMFPTALGQTVVDGGVTWVTVAFADPEMPQISGCDYEISPAGIAQVDDAIDATIGQTRVRLDAAAAAVGMYTITATMTVGTEEHVHTEDLEVVE